MAFQTVFKRYELKYLLHTAQYENLLQVMTPYMSMDQYGCTTIRNLYFDTPDYRLIRHSIERPAFKAKILKVIQGTINQPSQTKIAIKAQILATP